MATNRPFFLQYDIPERPVFNPRTGRTTSQPVYPNPSDALWLARCVRITYSCWLVMERDINPLSLVLHPMIEAGCRVYTIPFDVSATDELRTMALENIRREMSGLLVRAEESRAAADLQLDDESDTDFARRRRAYMSAARSIERRVVDMVARVGPAAERFGITQKDLRLDEAVSAVELLGSNMRLRAAAFAQAHGILGRRSGTEAASVRRGLASGDMPVPVVADWLRDNEEFNAGDELTSAFGDNF